MAVKLMHLAPTDGGVTRSSTTRVVPNRNRSGRPPQEFVSCIAAIIVLLLVSDGDLVFMASASMRNIVEHFVAGVRSGAKRGESRFCSAQERYFLQTLHKIVTTVTTVT